jgi:glycosyltransferase involved in cell wall biosynthesis
MKAIMKSESKVSVVLSAYNEETTIQNTLRSILNQTYTNIEIILVNDHSTDNTYNVLEKLNLKNLIYILNPKNLGLTRSLNIGITRASGKYICRIDAGDTFDMIKIEKQVDYLEKNEDYGIVGTWAKFFSSDGSYLYTLKTPEDDEAIKRVISDQTILIHPTVLIRKKLFDKYGLYDESYVTGQESELWIRFAEHTKYFNIQEPLVSCLHSASSISYRKVKQQIIDSIKIKFNEGLSISSVIFICLRIPLLLIPVSLINILRKTRYRLKYE